MPYSLLVILFLLFIRLLTLLGLLLCFFLSFNLSHFLHTRLLYIFLINDRIALFSQCLNLVGGLFECSNDSYDTVTVIIMVMTLTCCGSFLVLFFIKCCGFVCAVWSLKDVIEEKNDYDISGSFFCIVYSPIVCVGVFVLVVLHSIDRSLSCW